MRRDTALQKRRINAKRMESRGGLNVSYPAGASNDISVLRDSDGELQTEPSSIARALTQHWQLVFNQKATDANLRKTWLGSTRNRLAASMMDLRPTMEDVEKVFKRLHESAAGPDGIPSTLYSHLAHIAPTIFLDVVHAMLDGSADLVEAFNHAFPCCIPKSAEGITYQQWSPCAHGWRDSPNLYCRCLQPHYCSNLKYCTGAVCRLAHLRHAKWFRTRQKHDEQFDRHR